MGDLPNIVREIRWLSAAEKVEKYNDWLNDNPNDPVRHFIAEFRDEAQITAAKDEQIAAIAQQSAAKDEQIAAKDEQIAAKDEQIAAKDEQIAAKTLRSVKKEFPALYDCTNSMPHYPTNHKHADVQEVNMDEDTYSFIKKEFMNTKFWGADFNLPLKRNCDSESEAVMLISSLLMAVIKGLGLGDVIEVSHNRTLAGNECDILLVNQMNRLPFAVVEAKKPGNSKEGRQLIWEGKDRQNAVAGQIFDSMKAIQLFGFSRVFGFIATGNQWRMTGLYSSDDTMVTDDQQTDDQCLEDIKKNLKVSCNAFNALEIVRQLGARKTDGWVDQMQSAPLTSKAASLESPERSSVQVSPSSANDTTIRSIWASEIVPSVSDQITQDEFNSKVERAGEEIVTLVTLFIINAVTALQKYLHERKGKPHSIMIGKQIPCRILTSNDDVFAFGTCCLTKLSLQEFRHNLKKIHVIYHLGIGERGNCCLGVSKNGFSSCVVKFYHAKSDDGSEAETERDNWNNVYQNVKIFPECRTIKAAGRYCLVMPYLYPLPQSERKSLLVNGSIESALRTFATAGFIHNDVKWRHFGLWKGVVVLMDLGDVDRATKEEADSWVIETMNKLREKAQVTTTQTETSQESNGRKRKRKTK